ncbi:MAG: hypothetical protein AAFX03_06370 [Pseudomonadota bacterium]
MSLLGVLIFALLMAAVLFSLSKPDRRDRRSQDEEDRILSRLDQLADRISNLEAIATDPDRDLRGRFRGL